MDLGQLKQEITTDPASLGYAGKDDEQIADLLNRPTRTAPRESVDGGTLAASIVFSEYAALTAPQRQYVDMVVTAGTLPWTANLKQQLGALFAAGTQTRQNLVALQTRTGASRGEELGLGRVTPSDVADAKRLP